MTLLDIALIALILTVAVVQTLRGFGRALWDALALYGALWLAHTLSGVLGGGAVVYGLLLGTGGALGLMLSRWLHSITLLHAALFEGVLGLAAGLAAGVMLAHGVVQTVAASGPGGATIAESSGLGSELLSFRSYHATLDALQAETMAGRALPDVEH